MRGHWHAAGRTPRLVRHPRPRRRIVSFVGAPVEPRTRRRAPAAFPSRPRAAAALVAAAHAGRTPGVGARGAQEFEGAALRRQLLRGVLGRRPTFISRRPRPSGTARRRVALQGRWRREASSSDGRGEIARAVCAGRRAPPPPFDAGVAGGLRPPPSRVLRRASAPLLGAVRRAWVRRVRPAHGRSLHTHQRDPSSSDRSSASGRRNSTFLLVHALATRLRCEQLLMLDTTRATLVAGDLARSSRRAL